MLLDRDGLIADNDLSETAEYKFVLALHSSGALPRKFHLDSERMSMPREISVVGGRGVKGTPRGGGAPVAWDCGG